MLYIWLHLGALLKAIVATSLFCEQHRNHDVIHPTESVITELTHTARRNSQEP